MTLSPGKLKALHSLFGEMNIKDKEDKDDIIKDFTGGRTTSSRELTESEAVNLLAHLKKLGGTANRSDKMKKKIIRLAHEMNWKKEGSAKIDMKRINDWCIRSGYLHKKLDDYKYSELPKLVTQFENVHKDFINKL